MRVSLDSNILVYASGRGDPVRHKRARAILNSLGDQDAVMPAQALGEFFRVMTRKAGWPHDTARLAIKKWAESFTIAPTTSTVMLAAADLAVKHKIAIWDAVILAASSSAQCDTLLSEDMQDGFVWQGVAVVNPFVNADWSYR